MDIQKAPWDWFMSMQELAKITKETYGIEFDVQMGEMPQGSYETVTIGEISNRQGYATGMSNSARYPTLSDDYKYVYFDELRGTEGEDGFGAAEYDAMAKWFGQTDVDIRYRPFEKVNDNGEYAWYQPDLDVVMTDLEKRGKIPAGTYFIDISW